MRKNLLLLILLTSLSLAAASASAAVYSYAAFLDESQEVPANGAPGFGAGVFSFDDVSGEFTWDITFVLDIFDPGNVVTAAHIHAAPPGANGPVIINLATDGIVEESGIGANFGSFEGSVTLPPIHFPADVFVPDWYVNIHSVGFPSGQIRGNLAYAPPVPIPASAWMLLSGVAFMTAVRRKR